MDEQEPLERAGDVPAVLQRPDPLGAQAARPIQRRGEAALADLDGLLAEQLAGCRARPRRSCASSCACPHRARSWPSSLSPRLKADARRTWLAGGGATLLSSHAGTSPTGDERHSESQSGPTADSVKASQLAAGRSLSSRPDVTAPIQTASVKEPPEPANAPDCVWTRRSSLRGWQLASATAWKEQSAPLATVGLNRRNDARLIPCSLLHARLRTKKPPQ